MSRSRVLVALFVCLFLTCLGCAPTEGGEDSSPPAGANKPSDEAASEPAEEGANESETLAFGKSYTWEDGVTVTVGKPAAFKPSDYAKVKGAKDYRKFSVTVVNKSKQSIDLSLTYITMQSNNKEAEQVFDSENGLEGSPSTKLLKGRESKWEIGFGVANRKDMVMEVALQDDFVRPNVIYST